MDNYNPLYEFVNLVRTLKGLPIQGSVPIRGLFMDQPVGSYPVNFWVDYPEEPLDRLSTFFRIIAVIPIYIVLSFLTSGAVPLGSVPSDSSQSVTWLSTGGILAFAPLLMILFRQKYPRWWFDWNVALLKFQYRVTSYLLLLRDEYPSTDEE